MLAQMRFGRAIVLSEAENICGTNDFKRFTGRALQAWPCKYKNGDS